MSDPVLSCPMPESRYKHPKGTLCVYSVQHWALMTTHRRREVIFKVRWLGNRGTFTMNGSEWVEFMRHAKRI